MDVLIPTVFETRVKLCLHQVSICNV